MSTTSAPACEVVACWTSAAVGAWTISIPSGGAHREVRCDQRHLGAAALSFLGERDAHAPGGAVADEAHRVERLSCSTGSHEHVLASQDRAVTGVPSSS